MPESAITSSSASQNSGIRKKKRATKAGLRAEWTLLPSADVAVNSFGDLILGHGADDLFDHLAVLED